MYILTLETTGKYSSAAIIDGNGRCCSSETSDAMQHLQSILMSAENCRKQAGIQKDEITHVAASVGPGSFTGIRIGVSTARAIAQTMSLPCIAVSSLEGMAVRSLKYLGEAGQIATIINARRHQVYGAIWRAGKNGLTEICEQRQYMIEELLDRVLQTNEKTYFTGDGIDAYQDIIEDTLNADRYVLAETPWRYPSAESAARIALRKAQRGELLSYEELLPNYMRKSEAEMRLEAGTLSRKIHG